MPNVELVRAHEYSIVAVWQTATIINLYVLYNKRPSDIKIGPFVCLLVLQRQILILKVPEYGWLRSQKMQGDAY